jgi:hypothetical protein
MRAVKVSDAIAKNLTTEIIWTPALTRACAIDAVRLYPDETLKYVWLQTAGALLGYRTQNTTIHRHQ